MDKEEFTKQTDLYKSERERLQKAITHSIGVTPILREEVVHLVDLLILTDQKLLRFMLHESLDEILKPMLRSGVTP